jgi:hypothetical protein
MEMVLGVCRSCFISGSLTADPRFPGYWHLCAQCLAEQEAQIARHLEALDAWNGAARKTAPAPFSDSKQPFGRASEGQD